jgi:hypothetical protein
MTEETWCGGVFVTVHEWERSRQALQVIQLAIDCSRLVTTVIWSFIYVGFSHIVDDVGVSFGHRCKSW